MTAEEVNKDTKLKIIEAANELFAVHGFSGTSVRDIASAANVNIAAINYHFKNKENLYWQVFDYNYIWVAKNINILGDKATSTEDLSIKVFYFFLGNEHAMMNTFKLFLSNLTPPEGTLTIDEQEHFGPPGQEKFIEVIQRDFPEELTFDQKQWAADMIFSLIFHYGVVMNTQFMKTKCKNEDHISVEKMEESLRHSVRAHLLYLGSNSLE